MITENNSVIFGIILIVIGYFGICIVINILAFNFNFFLGMLAIFIESIITGIILVDMD